jgi:hypothetical protein
MQPTIFPASVTKYTGYIREYAGKRATTYNAVIHSHGRVHSQSWPRRVEAEDDIKAKNHEWNLPIKNKIHDMGDHYEVELSQGLRTKFDKADLPMIEAHVWCCSAQGYACTRIGDTIAQLHNILLNHVPGALTVDHTNVESLDNRRQNLRIVDKATQAKNRGVQKNNKTGIKNVHPIVMGGRHYYQAKVTFRGKKRDARFSVKKLGEDGAKQAAADWALLFDFALE